MHRHNRSLTKVLTSLKPLLAAMSISWRISLIPPSFLNERAQPTFNIREKPTCWKITPPPHTHTRISISPHYMPIELLVRQFSWPCPSSMSTLCAIQGRQATEGGPFLFNSRTISHFTCQKCVNGSSSNHMSTQDTFISTFEIEIQLIIIEIEHGTWIVKNYSNAYSIGCPRIFTLDNPAKLFNQSVETKPSWNEDLDLEAIWWG